MQTGIENIKQLVLRILDEYNHYHDSKGRFASGGAGGGGILDKKHQQLAQSAGVKIDKGNIIDNAGISEFSKMQEQWDIEQFYFSKEFEVAAKNKNLIVISSKDKIHGAMQLKEPTAHTLVVAFLETAPANRGKNGEIKGIGSTLMAHACSKVKPGQELRLLARPEANKFYKKIGMKKERQAFSFSYEQAHAFAKAMGVEK